MSGRRIPQELAAAWLRKHLELYATAETEDAAMLVLAAYEQLDPLCQLAGDLHVAAQLLRLGRARVSSLIDRGGAFFPEWLVVRAMQRSGAAHLAELACTLDVFLAAFEDVLRGAASRAGLSSDDAQSTFADLVIAVADGDERTVQSLLGSSDNTRLFAVSHTTILWLGIEVAALSGEMPIDALVRSSNDPEPVLDVADALARG